MQEIAEQGDCELRVHDLSALMESARELEVLRIIDELILEPTDITIDSLLAIALVRLREREHVLIVAMEHMISDASSINILLRDLFRNYARTLRSGVPDLPEIPVQFSDYAVWKAEAYESWTLKQGAQWRERFKDQRRLRFPIGASPVAPDRRGWATVRVEIGKDLKGQLLECSRRRGTTLVMTVFAAYVALVLRWCTASEAVILYQSDGRDRPEVENTIGYFASILYLHVTLSNGDRLVDLADRVFEEYCRAYEHADFSGMDTQQPPPEFVSNGHFNWVPREYKLASSEPSCLQEVISSSPVHFEHPVWRVLDMDAEPSVLFYDTDDAIAGIVSFPSNRFTVDVMRRFARNLIVFINVLVSNPEVRIQDIPVQ